MLVTSTERLSVFEDGEITQIAGALLAALGKAGQSSNVAQPNLVASRQLDQMHELKLGERATDGLDGESKEVTDIGARHR